ncbi:MAG: type II toxin-antitoxin system VapB family antitoxin [Victivallales bacterium]
MRTTLDLPNALVEEAMKLSHQRTKTAVLVTALEDFVRKTGFRDSRSSEEKLSWTSTLTDFGNANEHLG